MKWFFPNIKGIIYTLIFISVAECCLRFVGLDGKWGHGLSFAIPIINIFLCVSLLGILQHVKRKSADKDKQYQQLLDLSPEAIYVHTQGLVIYSNEAGANLFGVKEPSAIMNRRWKEILDDKSYESLTASSKQFKTDQQFKIHQFNLYRQDGSVRYVEAKSTYIEFDGKPAREVIARDITVQEKKQNLLKEYSYLDPLTQLPNRRRLLDQIDQLIRDSAPKKTSFGMMFLDLDGFKQINDTFGHEKGDFLLKEISKHLQLCVREEDVVGRFGGDEFIILLPEVSQFECILTAKRLIDDMPVFLQGEKASHVTLSIGISLYPQDGEEAQDLINHADLAMYEAKQKGKNNYQLFESMQS